MRVIELWYAILAFTLIVYLMLDGRNFGVGAIQRAVAKTPAERRQLALALGPLWPWHEVWLVVLGGSLFVAFPRVLAVSFTGYYLALYLVLWSLILRGMALEVGGHVEQPLWQEFWDFVFAASSVLLAILFGAALGNIARGVPVGDSGQFQMPFFTNFRTRGQVGLLDWYTVSMAIFTLLALSAHGATYLTLKTEGPVCERSRRLAKKLWILFCPALAVVFAETWFVRPHLPYAIASRPLAIAAVLIAIAGAAAIFHGFRQDLSGFAFIGSWMLLAGLLVASAAAMFPTMLRSTLGDRNSLTAYNSAAGANGLKIAAIWWPVAVALSLGYSLYILRLFRGKVPADR